MADEVLRGGPYKLDDGKETERWGALVAGVLVPTGSVREVRVVTRAGADRGTAEMRAVFSKHGDRGPFTLFEPAGAADSALAERVSRLERRVGELERRLDAEAPAAAVAEDPF